MTRLFRGDLSIELAPSQSWQSGERVLDAIEALDQLRVERARRRHLHNIDPMTYVCHRCGLSAAAIHNVPYGGAECHAEGAQEPTR